MKAAIVLTAHNTGFGVIRALGEQGIPVIALYYDPLDMGYVSKYVTASYEVPRPDFQEKKFIKYLCDFAADYRDCLLIPADDATLVSVSNHKALLENYYRVACTESEITKKFIEKSETAIIAEKAGIPHPKTLVPKNEEEVEAFSKTIMYPVMVKPSLSHLFFDIFKVKMFKVHNADELLSVYKKILPTGLEVMLQEYIPGDDTSGVNYNSYVWDGHFYAEFTAEKVRLAPPESGAPCVVVSKEIPEILEMGRKIINSMDFYGYSCAEFKKDSRDGIYKLMEVNGRHNRSSLLAYKCGINFPLMQYNHLIHKNLQEFGGEFGKNYKKGVYWIDITKDVFVSIKYLRKKGYTLSRFLHPYTKDKIFATLNFRDLKPFIKRCSDLIGRIFRGIFRGKK